MCYTCEKLRAASLVSGRTIPEIREEMDRLGTDDPILAAAAAVGGQNAAPEIAVKFWRALGAVRIPGIQKDPTTPAPVHS